MTAVVGSQSKMLREKQKQLAEAVVERQYRLQPEVWEKFGAVGWKKSIRDVNYHLTYLAEALDFEVPELFLHYIGWVKSVFAGIGLPADALPTTLEVTRTVLKDMLPEEENILAVAYLVAALERLPQMPVEAPSFMPTQEPYAELARQYFNSLIRSDRHAASRLIIDHVQQGMSVRDIYLQVFQPVQHEVGRLWQMNRLTVAQEHYCTAATQFIMAQLYPFVFATEKTARRLVAACVGSELHELGIRMVADLFEMHGWQTYYLGANMPTTSIVQTVMEQQAEVLCLSATLPLHLSLVAEVIAALRAADSSGTVKVLVGGYPFNVAPALWQRVGADGSAPDALQTIALAERLAA